MSKTVLCASSAYEQKYYLNPTFERLPEIIQQEIKILCVLFTEEVGGTFGLSFLEDGTLLIDVDKDEGDILYDEIGAGLMVRKITREKEELFRQLELYYKVMILGQKVEEL